jgi:hypothetical protein
MKRVSIYISKEKKWLLELLKNRVEGGKLTGRETSVGRELLHAAEQHFLRDLYEKKNAST